MHIREHSGVITDYVCFVILEGICCSSSELYFVVSCQRLQTRQCRHLATNQVDVVNLEMSEIFIQVDMYLPGLHDLHSNCLQRDAWHLETFSLVIMLID